MPLVDRCRYSKMNVFEIKQFEGSNPRVGCFYDALPRAMSATPKYSSPGMTRAVRKLHSMKHARLFSVSDVCLFQSATIAQREIFRSCVHDLRSALKTPMSTEPKEYNCDVV